MKTLHTPTTIVTVFRSRLRPEFREEYEQWAHKIQTLAAEAPGFIAIKTYVAEDGERVSIVEFESMEATLAWRNQPDHVEAQHLGQKLFYSEYRIQVCRTIRDYQFIRGADAAT
jgi:heme-degrading monooxygenase HmoA